MKKFFCIFLLFTVFAGQKAFSNVNESEYIEKGNSFLSQAEANQYPELNGMYLKKAQYYFYVASKNTPPSVEALIGLGRVYMLQNKTDDAKNTLFRAYSLDPYSAEANFYFAEFCFQNAEFETALKYYQNAYNLSFKDRIKNAQMIKKCYDKLGDTEKLQEY